MFSLKSLVAAAALVISVAAQGRTIQILAVQDLSLDDTFVFKPREIRANVGDVLEFHFAPTAFLPSNHSVAQGTFERACEPLPSGFFSGNVTAPPGTPLGEAVGLCPVFQPAVRPGQLGERWLRPVSTVTEGQRNWIKMG